MRYYCVGGPLKGQWVDTPDLVLGDCLQINEAIAGSISTNVEYKYTLTLLRWIEAPHQYHEIKVLLFNKKKLRAKRQRRVCRMFGRLIKIKEIDT